MYSKMLPETLLGIFWYWRWNLPLPSNCYLDFATITIVHPLWYIDSGDYFILIEWELEVNLIALWYLSWVIYRSLWTIFESKFLLECMFSSSSDGCSTSAIGGSPEKAEIFILTNNFTVGINSDKHDIYPYLLGHYRMANKCHWGIYRAPIRRHGTFSINHAINTRGVP